MAAVSPKTPRFVVVTRVASKVVRSRVVVALSAELKALVNPVPDKESDTTKFVIVEEAALMRIAAVVLVGLRMLAAKVSQEPFVPAGA